MNIRYEMLRVFRVVAEEGSLAAAAVSLHRTPSAVSMMLAQFTDSLGAPLFETERKNRLTPLGHLVLEECRRATDAFDRCTDAIQRNVLSAAGTVRIASVPSAAVSLLPHTLAAFRQRSPDVRLEISDVDSQEGRRRVRFDEADIAIISDAVSEPMRDDVILQDRLGIVYNRQGAIAERLQLPDSTPDWELLLLEPLIANPLCNMVGKASIQALLLSGRLQVRSTTTLLSYVQHGLGATVLPLNAITRGMDGIAYVQPDNPPVHRQLRKIRHPDRHLSPAGELFWQALS